MESESDPFSGYYDQCHFYGPSHVYQSGSAETYTYGYSDPSLVSQPSSADPGTSGTDKEGSPEVEVPGVITQV